MTNSNEIPHLSLFLSALVDHNLKNSGYFIDTVHLVFSFHSSLFICTEILGLIPFFFFFFKITNDSRSCNDKYNFATLFSRTAIPFTTTLYIRDPKPLATKVDYNSFSREK